MRADLVVPLAALAISTGIGWRYRREAARIVPVARPLALCSIAMLGLTVLNAVLETNRTLYANIATAVPCLAALFYAGNVARKRTEFTSSEKRAINLLWVCVTVFLLSACNALINLATK